MAAGLARWQAVRDACKLTFNDAAPNTWVPCVYSRLLSQALINPTSIVTADVTNAFLNKRIGSMAHRKAKSVY